MQNQGLLIINESGSRKKEPASAIPASDRFTGLSMKVVKKAQRQGFGKNVDTLILTSLLGLVDWNESITYYPPSKSWPISYKQDFNKSKEKELRDKSEKKVNSVLNQKEYSEVFVNVGYSYLPIIQGALKGASAKGLKVSFAKGPMGEKARVTREWILELVNLSLM